MYGNNNGSNISMLTRVAGLVGLGAGGASVTTATGIVLPDTGDNLAIHALSYTTIGLGILVLFSYVVTRIVTRNKSF